jgi:serine/threonine protein kinase/cytochrome c-type biogenesis protein CcmH/NrfG
MTPLDVDSVVAHYRLLQPLGRGGMGMVWKAFDEALGRAIALKVLFDSAIEQPEKLALLATEARALAALNHPNIVTIYSVEEADGVHFLTMELVDGEPLTELLPEHGFPLERFLTLASAIADATSAAHERGVTHRDLKPGNVMVGRDGRVKVVDFGLASVTEPLADRADLDRTAIDVTAVARARGLGSLYYVPPERVQGQPEDERSDIFSLGVLLYEMATGRRPFEGPTPSAVLQALLMRTPEPPNRLRPDLPSALTRLIMRCLDKNPHRRVQSASEILQVLEQVRGGIDLRPRPALKSIAVLPFDDLSEERNQAHLCEGLAEEILTGLARIPGLRVASRAITFGAKASGLEPLDIAARLQAGALVDGSVRRSGERLRISVELVNALDGLQLWGDKYDFEMRDVFAIQDDISHRIVEALQLTLSATEETALTRRYTSDVDAYDCYLRGRSFYYRFNRRAIEFARGLFTHAVQIDPAYARGYAGLADCSAYLYSYVSREDALLQGALEAAHKAIELAPDLSEAHASMGAVLSLAGRHAEANEAFENAIRLNPQLFEAHYFWARAAFVQGRLEDAVHHYENASRVRPEDFQAPLLMAQSCEVLGRVEEAEAARRRGVAIAEQHLRLNPDDVRALYMGANGLVALGERARGLEWARRALSMESADSMVLYNLACIYAMAGETSEALDCVERAVRAGLTQRGWLEHDSNLDSIRGLVRFQALLDQLK